jgi:flagellar basal-body rod modification protein FlgD
MAFSGEDVRWAYSLPQDAATANLTVVDSTGKTVWTGAAPSTGKGRHDFVWDGKDADGATVPDGVYTLKVAAKAADGGDLLPTVFFTGRVTSIEQADGQTLLKIGPSKVGLSSIAEVTG